MFEENFEGGILKKLERQEEYEVWYLWSISKDGEKDQVMREERNGDIEQIVMKFLYREVIRNRVSQKDDGIYKVF